MNTENNTSHRPSPSLFMKHMPQQQRGQETVELILSATAGLLAEVGVERVSTNMIVARAGVTPPALYRYFSDKYAVFKALAARLMDLQNIAWDDWVAQRENRPPANDIVALTLDLASMQAAVNAATRTLQGAVWVMRAMRVLPPLRDIRLESHAIVSARSFDDLRERFPHADPMRLQIASRITMETMYAATEMVFDDPTLDEDQINNEVSEMVVRYILSIVQ